MRACNELEPGGRQSPRVARRGENKPDGIGPGILLYFYFLAAAAAADERVAECGQTSVAAKK